MREGENDGLANLNLGGTIRIYSRENVMDLKTGSPNQAIHHRNYQRARSRALTRLSKIYKDDYKLFLQEEREKDEKLGKKWVGFDSNSSPVHTIQSFKDTIEGGSPTDPTDEGENPSYDGGEA